MEETHNQSHACKHSQKSLLEYSFFLAESHYFKKDCRRLPFLPRKMRFFFYLAISTVTEL